jgi:hypothetical protein
MDKSIEQPKINKNYFEKDISKEKFDESKSNKSNEIKTVNDL